MKSEGVVVAGMKKAAKWKNLGNSHHFLLIGSARFEFALFRPGPWVQPPLDPPSHRWEVDKRH
jgi:hypothetical protein